MADFRRPPSALRSAVSKVFLCSRIRENSDAFEGVAPNSHESGYLQHTPLGRSRVPAGHRKTPLNSASETHPY